VLKPGGLFFSETLMTGSYGDRVGSLLEGEPRTYYKTAKEATHNRQGILRFTSEEDIADLHAPFRSIKYDHLIRSDKNRKYEHRKWLITSKK
jgi:hypothetical protein